MNYKIFFLVSLLVVCLDQFFKILILKDIISLSFGKNTGAAFGIFKGFNMELIWFSIIVIGVILFMLEKIEEKYVIFTALLLGGIVGNLIDRIMFGKVIDFIDFYVGTWHWPAFNVADSALTVGIILFIISTLTQTKRVN